MLVQLSWLHFAFSVTEIKTVHDSYKNVRCHNLFILIDHDRISSLEGAWYWHRAVLCFWNWWTGHAGWCRQVIQSLLLTPPQPLMKPWLTGLTVAVTIIKWSWFVEREMYCTLWLVTSTLWNSSVGSVWNICVKLNDIGYFERLEPLIYGLV